MKLAIAHRFATITRSLPGPTLWQLRREVPQYLARTRGLDNPEFLHRLALAAVKPLSPSAGPTQWDAMAFYLVAMAGIAEVESSADLASNPPQDSMSEMGEMQTLRLQLAMDRMARVTTVLSNIMKKQSETARSIIQNLK